MILHNGQPARAFVVRRDGAATPSSRETANGLGAGRLQDSPSLWRKAKNLAGAGARVAKAAVKREKVTVVPEEHARRIGICEGCEFYTGTTCKKCGCVVKFKSRLATEHCPIGKW